MNKYFASFLLICSLNVYASTFVGNGGNAGDLDLSIALAEIHGTFQDLDKQSPTLCRCPDELATNELCAVLRSLNSQQINFCKKMLIDHKELIVAMSSNNSNMKFTWYDENLKVKEVDGSTRIVDAVSQNEHREVILNRPRFLEMPHSFRIALLTHEFYHFVVVDEEFISDEKEMAPFKDGKSLLDTLGAATAMEAYSMDVTSDFQHLDRVSRGYKKFIFQFDLKSIEQTSKSARKLLKKGSSSGTSLTFEYKPKNLGFRLGLDEVLHSSVYRGAVSVEETLQMVSLGVGYHWFPVSARLSRWNEAHISAFLEPLYGSAKYLVNDEAMSLKDKGRVSGGQLSLQIHIPFVSGFWATVGQQIRYLEYKYSVLDIKISEIQKIFYLGGAYAF